jgi:hypothetical protein
MALLRRRLWLAQTLAAASHLSAPHRLTANQSSTGPGMYLGTPVKNGITIGGSAACSINSLSAHIRASRRSGEGSPESGSQVQSWSPPQGTIRATQGEHTLPGLGASLLASAAVGFIAISMYGGRGCPGSGSRQEIGFGLTYMLDLSSFGLKSLLSLWNLDKRFRIFWRARCSILRA